jgi:hypothetical protein
VSCSPLGDSTLACDSTSPAVVALSRSSLRTVYLLAVVWLKCESARAESVLGCISFWRALLGSEEAGLPPTYISIFTPLAGLGFSQSPVSCVLTALSGPHTGLQGRRRRVAIPGGSWLAGKRAAEARAPSVVPVAPREPKRGRARRYTGCLNQVWSRTIHIPPFRRLSAVGELGYSSHPRSLTVRNNGVF